MDAGATRCGKAWERVLQAVRRSVERLAMGVAADEGPPRSPLRRAMSFVLAAAAPALIACVCLVESSVESRQLVQTHRVAMVTRALRQQAADRGEDLRALEMLLRPRNELDWRMFD